jgi:hypothetical protein
MVPYINRPIWNLGLCILIVCSNLRLFAELKIKSWLARSTSHIKKYDIVKHSTFNLHVKQLIAYSRSPNWRYLACFLKQYWRFSFLSSSFLFMNKRVECTHEAAGMYEFLYCSSRLGSEYAIQCTVLFEIAINNIWLKLRDNLDSMHPVVCHILYNVYKE